ncbi:MAG: lantibiotic dehydratase [Sphingobacterium sp.]|jgi:thiopeptide-type bacteriocin biosynthesis protein|uniref:lantibiotic dehydratase n=1 Tax=Sphingobacterium sp. TaxID=341027 RepID=UPI002844B696|nr:thiopeptide-type bacteriocin biosynthesis protein [Sphingobacterium sp.]MDR3008611.1 lantibiotic dehydratase [Sphingobacterium sp.]
MKLNLNKKVLFRTPQFPANANLKDSWEELKASIKISSPDFYSIIESMQYKDIENDSRPVQSTIAKYFNRAKFRPTPYGTFASIGIGTLGRAGEYLVVDEKMSRKRFKDWNSIISAQNQWRDFPLNTLCYQANTSFYKCGDLIRCIFKNEGHFELSDISYYPVIEDILEYCTHTKSFDEITIQFKNLFEDTAALEQILEVLIDNQLLFTNFQANIIDEAPEMLQPLDREKSYDICFRSTVSGSFYFPYVDELKELITFLSSHSALSAPKELSEFRDKFVKQYDQQAIPLLQALDPEIGIGYGDFENNSNSELLGLFGHNGSRQGGANLSKMIQKGVSVADNIPTVIQLEQYKQNSRTIGFKLPNTFNAILNPAENSYLLNMLGGATANNVLGRFTFADHKVHELCKENASTESLSNPDVLFFDIAYSGEAAVDNISRRCPIYEYHVSIHSLSNGSKQISLNDIYVAIRAGEVVLYSKELKKRLVPRLSNAYRYTRSELSLFRFLCDIQSQNIVQSLLPNVDSLFDGMSFKPRISYKHLILSPASWRINLEDFPCLNNSFKDKVSKSGKYKFVKFGYTDQTLHLDTESPEDLQLLYSILKANKEIWVQESFSSECSPIRDTEGNLYHSEFILSIFHEETIYQGIDLNLKESIIQRTFLPGSEWLYFELFLHPGKTDEVLLNDIKNILEKMGDLIKLWFFIRYDEMGSHLRLRFRLKHVSYYGVISDQMHELITTLKGNGFLKDAKICTYEREIERYGADIMEQVEGLFYRDSLYVLNLINELSDIPALYLNTIQLIIAVGDAIFGMGELQGILTKLVNAHNTEHLLGTSAFKIINSFYKREIRARSTEIALPFNSEIIKVYITILLPLVRKRQIQLFADLFHMHINRLFSDHQREHETLIYNFALSKIKEMQYLQPALAF